MTNERYKKIMADLGMPNNSILLQALQHVANEVAQETLDAERASIERRVGDCGSSLRMSNAELSAAIDIAHKMTKSTSMNEASFEVIVTHLKDLLAAQCART